MKSRILCSIKEAAQALGVCRTTTYGLLASGDLSSVRIGGRRLVTVDSIMALVSRASGGAA